MKKLHPELVPEDKELMEKLLSAGHIKHKVAVRLRTVLLRAQGEGTTDIARFLGIHKSSVSAYINRYNAFGINSLLQDKTRKPGKEPISQEVKNKIYSLVCNEKPKDATHWSSRSLAKQVGISLKTP
jgi:transposase